MAAHRGGILVAMVADLGISAWRSFDQEGIAPWPGDLLWGAAAFAVLLIVAGAGDEESTVAFVLAVALVIANLLRGLPNTSSAVKDIKTAASGKPTASPPVSVPAPSNTSNIT